MIKTSPLTEGLLKRGYDVLLLPEPIDEYCVGSLGKYDGKFDFKDISKEGLKLSDAEEEKLKELNTKFEPLTNYLREILSEKVTKVQISNKLSHSPCAIVSQTWGYSANMERIMKAQALKDERYMPAIGGKRILELNPRHPIVKRLLDIVETDSADPSTEDIAHVLYDVAVLNSGYALSEPSDLTGRINKMMSKSLEVDPNMEIEEEVFVEEEVDVVEPELNLEPELKVPDYDEDEHDDL